MPKTPVGKFIVGTTLIVVGVVTGNPYVASMGINLVLGGVAQNIAQNKAKGTPEQKSDPIKINFDGEESPLFLVFGQIRVGGHVSFMGTYGTNNKFLGLGITHSATTKAGCNDITDIFLDENRIDDTIIDGNGDITSGQYQGLVKIIRYVGEDSSTFDTTIADNITYMDNTALGKGLARTHIRLEKVTDDEAFRKAFPRGVPGISALLQSVCYDPRNDSTNGGSGSERYTDADTWTFSQNPAVIAGTYLITAQSDGGWGIDATAIDWTTLAASANRCDELVSRPDNLGGSVNAARHTCNVILDTGDSGKTNMDKILSTMDGSLITGLDGKIKILVGEYDVPTTTIDKTWLRNQGATVTYDTDDNQIYNAVRAHYIEPTTGFQKISCIPFTDSGYETTDGRREWKELDLSATTDRYEAQYLCAIEGRKSRHQKTAVLSLNYKGFNVEAWENVTLSLSDLGLSGTFKVINWRHEVEGPVITVLEQTSTAWDSAFADYTETIPTPAPALVSETPPTPTGLTAISVADGIQLSWDAVGSGEYSETLIERSTTSGSGFAKIAETRGNTYHDAVTNGSTFYYRIRNRSALKKGVYSAYSSEATNAAKTVADGATKHQHFVQTTAPTGGTYTVGDTWTRWPPPADEPRIKQVYIWDGDSWELSANQTDITTMTATSGTDANIIPNGYITTQDNFGFSEWSYYGAVGSTGSTSQIPGAGLLSSGNGINIKLEGDFYIPVNPDDWYSFSAWVRATGGGPYEPLYLGFVPYTADKKQINPKNILTIAGTRTPIDQPALVGTNTVHLTSAANWEDVSSRYIVFNAEPSDTDLPNFEIYGITDVTGRTVTLDSNLTQTYGIGTEVRQHKAGAAYMYTLASNETPGFPTHFTGAIRGPKTDFQDTTDLPNRFWPGTRYLRILALVNWAGSGGTGDVLFGGFSGTVITAGDTLLGLENLPNKLPWWKKASITNDDAFYYLGSGRAPNVAVANTGANFNAASSPLTSFDAGSTATVDIAAFSLRYADGLVSYNSGQVVGESFGAKRHCYVDDVGRLGGGVTYVLTASDADVTASDGRIWVGDITTATNGGSPTGGGGGGGGCIDPDAVLMPGLRARDARMGDTLLVLHGAGAVDEGTIVDSPRTLMRPRVRLTAASGATLVVSVDTPVQQPDGQQILAAHLHGGQIYTEQADGSWAWEAVLDPAPLPVGPVIAFSVGDGSFAAGSAADDAQQVRRLMTHNKIT